ILLHSNDSNEELSSNKFIINADRETIVIPSRRYIMPEEIITLRISYNGTSRMKGVGLYESWTHREGSLSSSRSYISLLTNLEPARARQFFPCFDEPDKRAVFRLTIEHPQHLNAYSNTPIKFSSTKNKRKTTQFEKTSPLPPYLVALAITEQPIHTFEVDGYKIRAIGRNGSISVQRTSEALEILRANRVFDNATFFPTKTGYFNYKHGHILRYSYC
ncbi:hypothetical protein PFISCL1PPCAC_5490, partial [Pristionchus fissidentatus]